MFHRSETSNVSPRIDFQRDLERDKQLPFPDDQSIRFKAPSLFLAELKTFIASVCIFVRRHATKNKTFDLGFKSPCDACLGLQMAQKQHRVGLLKCKLFFFQNSANLCAGYYISGREFFTVGDNLISERRPDTRGLTSCLDTAMYTARCHCDGFLSSLTGQCHIQTKELSKI